MSSCAARDAKIGMSSNAPETPDWLSVILLDSLCETSREQTAMALYLCPTCGSTNSLGRSHCTKCGRRLEDVKRTSSELVNKPSPLSSPKNEPHTYLSPGEIKQPAQRPSLLEQKSRFWDVTKDLLRTWSFRINTACLLMSALLWSLQLTGLTTLPRAIHFFGLSYDGIVHRFWLFEFATAPFVHLDMFQLTFNILAIGSLGPSVEKILGRSRFLILCVVTCITSAVIFLLFTATSNYVLAGCI